MSTFHDLAFTVLYGEPLLGCPVGLDGYRDDLYLRKRDYEKLGTAVALHFDGVSVDQFVTASQADQEVWLRKLLKATPKAEQVRTLENGEKTAPEDVPAEFRARAKPDGEILATPYLLSDSEWPFTNRKEFTDAWHKGKLTRRIKVGRAHAYLYTELSAMWRDDSLIPEDDSETIR